VDNDIFGFFSSDFFKLWVEPATVINDRTLIAGWFGSGCRVGCINARDAEQDDQEENTRSPDGDGHHIQSIQSQQI
jgi:hypothetical protein